jgi:hypothetical protein
MWLAFLATFSQQIGTHATLLLSSHCYCVLTTIGPPIAGELLQWQESSFLQESICFFGFGFVLSFY